VSSASSQSSGNAFVGQFLRLDNKQWGFGRTASAEESFNYIRKPGTELSQFRLKSGIVPVVYIDSMAPT